MTNLRTRIAAVLYAMDCDDYDIQVGEEMDPAVLWAIREGAERRADAVIRELPELRRLDHVREVCVASLNLDRVPGEALSDRAWLADTVLNVLNGEVDD